MALSSWHLGTDAAAALAGRRRARGSLGGLVLVPAFLFFFSLSAFFSYTYYHANFFGLSSKRMEGELQPRELALKVAAIVDEAFNDAHKKQAAAVIATKGAQDWIASIDALDKAAGEGGRDFETMFRKKQEVAIEAEKKRIADARAARDQLEKIKKEIGDLRRVIAAEEEIINPQQTKIDELKAEVEKETSLARAAEQGLDASGKPRCGRFAKDIRTRCKLREPRPTGSRKHSRAIAKSGNRLWTRLTSCRRRFRNLEKVANAAPATDAGRAGVVDVRAELAALKVARTASRTIRTCPPLSVRREAARRFLPPRVSSVLRMGWRRTSTARSAPTIPSVCSKSGTR